MNELNIIKNNVILVNEDFQIGHKNLNREALYVLCENKKVVNIFLLPVSEEYESIVAGTPIYIKRMHGPVNIVAPNAQYYIERKDTTMFFVYTGEKYGYVNF